MAFRDDHVAVGADIALVVGHFEGDVEGAGILEGVVRLAGVAGLAVAEGPRVFADRTRGAQRVKSNRERSEAVVPAGGEARLERDLAHVHQFLAGAALVHVGHHLEFDGVGAHVAVFMGDLRACDGGGRLVAEVPLVAHDLAVEGAARGTVELDDQGGSPLFGGGLDDGLDAGLGDDHLDRGLVFELGGIAREQGHYIGAGLLESGFHLLARLVGALDSEIPFVVHDVLVGVGRAGAVERDLERHIAVHNAFRIGQRQGGDGRHRGRGERLGLGLDGAHGLLAAVLDHLERDGEKAGGVVHVRHRAADLERGAVAEIPFVARDLALQALALARVELDLERDGSAEGGGPVDNRGKQRLLAQGHIDVAGVVLDHVVLVDHAQVDAELADRFKRVPGAKRVLARHLVGAVAVEIPIQGLDLLARGDQVGRVELHGQGGGAVRGNRAEHGVGDGQREEVLPGRVFGAVRLVDFHLQADVHRALGGVERGNRELLGRGLVGAVAVQVPTHIHDLQFLALDGLHHVLGAESHFNRRDQIGQVGRADHGDLLLADGRHDLDLVDEIEEDQPQDHDNDHGDEAEEEHADAAAAGLLVALFGEEPSEDADHDEHEEEQGDGAERQVHDRQQKAFDPRGVQAHGLEDRALLSASGDHHDHQNDEHDEQADEGQADGDEEFGIALARVHILADLLRGQGAPLFGRNGPSGLGRSLGGRGRRRGHGLFGTRRSHGHGLGSLVGLGFVEHWVLF